MNDDFTFQGQEDIPSPQLIYYKDRIEENTRHAISIAGSPGRLWPHVKTHKMLELTRLLTRHGITSFKCATISELEMCAMAGAGRALLAYPLVGPNIRRFLSLRDAYPGTRFYALVDDMDIARSFPSPIDVFIDVNLGMDRTGIRPGMIPSFMDEAARLGNIKVVGLHCYDGQIHDSDLDSRTWKAEAAYESVKPFINDFEYVIMGGSPTFAIYARHGDVQLSPGTLFVNDHGYHSSYPDLDFPPAAAVLTRVVSHPGDGLFTLDLGCKGIASDPAGARGVITSLPGAEPLFQSEEHWVWRMQEGVPPAIGTELFVVPTHICPTTALYDHAVVVEDGKEAGAWEVSARNRKINY